MIPVKRIQLWFKLCLRYGVRRSSFVAQWMGQRQRGQVCLETIKSKPINYKISRDVFSKSVHPFTISLPLVSTDSSKITKSAFFQWASQFVEFIWTREWNESNPVEVPNFFDFICNCLNGNYHFVFLQFTSSSSVYSLINHRSAFDRVPWKVALYKFQLLLLLLEMTLKC